MAYRTAEARQQLLDAVVDATDEIGFALACLGAAYEQLGEHTADRLEEELYRPIQRASGRAKRTHAEFAAPYELRGRSFEQQRPGLPSSGARGFIDNAVAAAGQADRGLAALQDSPLWLEVGCQSASGARGGTRAGRRVPTPSPRACANARALGAV